MGAFYSGTDDNNDKSGIYYSAVIGKLTETTYEYVIRFNLYDTKKSCVLGDVFDIPVQRKAEVKQEWLDQVDLRTYSTPAPYRPQQRSMWDNQTAHIPNPSSKLPFGFEESSALNSPDSEGRGGHKNTKGKEGGISKSPNLGSWPYSQEGFVEIEAGDIFVPGPNDEALLERVMGFSDSNEVAMEIAEKYGKEEAESYTIIDDFLANLEGIDEGLMDIITQAYAMMSTEGQMKLAQNGLS